MRPTGHRWRTLKERFKQDCRNRRAVCVHCRQPIDYDIAGQSAWAFEADHKDPVATHPWRAYDYTNLQPSHSKCNRVRRDRPNANQDWVTPSW
jgi:5-methylcytosine-specific restriction endonuclease McrA